MHQAQRRVVIVDIMHAVRSRRDTVVPVAPLLCLSLACILGGAQHPCHLISKSFSGAL